ncbi:MAG: hypothetical protein WBO10_17960 [Pyrinomonadaceae bacterium]
MADSDWLPGTLSGLRDMFSNVLAKIASHATALGLSAPAVTEIILLCEEFLESYDYVDESDATASALRKWRQKLLYGMPEGDPLAAAPPFGTLTMPVGSVIGIIALFREYRRQMVAASGYTPAIGEDLMIVKVDSDPLFPGDVTPSIQVFPAQSGNMFSIIVTNRGEADSWIAQLRFGGGAWDNAGTYTGRAADVTVTPPEAGKPFQVDVRVLLRKANQNYGNVSQNQTVTLNP